MLQRTKNIDASGLHGNQQPVFLAKTAARVRLLDLDQRALLRPTQLVAHGDVDDRLLADWHARLRVVADQIAVERSEFFGRDRGSGTFGQRLRDRDQRVARAAQHAGLMPGASAGGCDVVLRIRYSPSAAAGGSSCSSSRLLQDSSVGDVGRVKLCGAAPLGRTRQLQH